MFLQFLVRKLLADKSRQYFGSPSFISFIYFRIFGRRRPAATWHSIPLTELEVQMPSRERQRSSSTASQIRQRSDVEPDEHPGQVTGLYPEELVWGLLRGSYCPQTWG